MEFNCVNIALVSKAAMFRVILTSTVFQNLLLEYQEIINSDEYIIAYRFSAYASTSIFYQLLLMSETSVIPPSLATDVPRKRLQAKIIRILRPEFSSGSPSLILLPRYRKWLPSFTLADMDRCFLMMNMASQFKIPPFMKVALLKSICNGWNTTRRYRQGAISCRFGCQAVGGDCQLHYCSCPVAYNYLHEVLPHLPSAAGSDPYTAFFPHLFSLDIVCLYYFP